MDDSSGEEHFGEIERPFNRRERKERGEKKGTEFFGGIAVKQAVNDVREMKEDFPATGAMNCSAELNSAVSQICNLRSARKVRLRLQYLRFAECNSAIQQIENLRYVFGASVCHALLHFQSVTERHRRALTGLFKT
jgi:hypothetical protein